MPEGRGRLNMNCQTLTGFCLICSPLRCQRGKMDRRFNRKIILGTRTDALLRVSCLRRNWKEWAAVSLFRVGCSLYCFLNLFADCLPKLDHRHGDEWPCQIRNGLVVFHGSLLVRTVSGVQYRILSKCRAL